MNMNENIPKNNESYSTFSRKVVIDEYKQQCDLTKCTKCNEKYYNIRQIPHVL